MQLIAYRTGHAHAHALARLFYVDAERNIPSDFSTTSSRELHWIILSVGFLLMAADEAGSFHGRLIEPIRGLIGAHGFGIFFFAWVIPGIAVVIVSRTITEQYDSGWTAVPTCQTHDNIVSTESSSYDGGCTCRYLRYRMSSTPLFVNCCHCRWCQRETGASYALNALIETDRVQLLAGEVERVDTPSNSGKGQVISRCPRCRIAVWSNYGGGGDAVRFVRVGTLDEPDRLQPDIHIFTESKQPWVTLPPGARAVPQYYKASEYWPRESLERRAALAARR